MKNAINSVLAQYGLSVDNVISGARITHFCSTLSPSAPVTKLMKLKSAFCIALNNNDVNVFINGNQFVVEVPTGNGIVRFKDCCTKQFQEKKGLYVVLGQSVDGQNLYTDLAKQPHMLVAGVTGGGKSMFLNSLMTSIIMKDPQTELFVIDGKGSEFSQFRRIPDHRFQYFSETSQALTVLNFLCRKMDERYETMAKHGWRDIETAEANGHKFNRAVCVIDELADLMLKDKSISRQIEEKIVRLAQKSRAAGLHLVLATQRPSSDVVTGLIKANIPCRVCFRTTSAMESRIVLDRKGAEKLLDKGDMLFLGKGNMDVIRVQAPLITEEEIGTVVEWDCQYLNNLLQKYARR